jgi:hypothetical protein
MAAIVRDAMPESMAAGYPAVGTAVNSAGEN